MGFYALVFFLLVAGYSLFSKRLDSDKISLPTLFAFGGLLCALGMPWLIPETEQPAKAESLEVISLLAELTLVIVLFSDASLLRWSALRYNWKIPARMLTIGMPLSILLGMLVTWLFLPDLAWPGLLFLAATLAATDASLAKPVVTDLRVPGPIRDAINMESGLNDGLAVPMVIYSAALIAASAGDLNTTTLNPGSFILRELVLAPLLGALISFLLAKGFNMEKRLNGYAASQHPGGFAEEYQSIFFLATACICYSIAELLQSSGFIAAFVGGLVFGNTVKQHKKFIEQFMDAEGQLFTMLTFFLFGLFMIPICIEYFSWNMLLLALCYLTLVRMLPVWLSLLGARQTPLQASGPARPRPLTTREKLFMAWFGPRGLASVLFALLFMQSHQFIQYSDLIACIVMTVILSIMLHGVSAASLCEKLYRRRFPQK
ncbi:cation:proton antiporter [Neptuniibacter halophilus]|uniref:cation:proton antiporter n=1 Tax=Neptuniibacter halophilus TaxID=651666 RepID=UPI002573398D|nr:cation:proton antiporter [Neptuniibacter halophilus]